MTLPFPLSKLDEWERLCREATPGPWEYNDPAKFTQGWGKFSETAVYAPGNAFPWRMVEVQGPTSRTEIATAKLIAEARSALPVLIEAVRELRKALEPFADWITYHDGLANGTHNMPDAYQIGSNGPTLGQLRAARAALGEASGVGEAT